MSNNTSNVAIKVENLGKKYIIKHEKQENYKTFQDVLINSGKKIITSLNPFDKHSSTCNETTEDFWALNDVNFIINKGDKVGIIGRNGAGKSTLLKVLSRITEPTTGKININGRIASLLEVGTGFHPELTGRENIYLNGAILGMSRKEIKTKFDEIVAFAEVDKFLDTPVKRYSSGMYVRLAFSVAAHLEPEILVVDEVLAVGDVEFQKKCLGKMGEVSKEGRTILFVSHNMNAIAQLCNKGILLNNGTIELQSNSIAELTSRYLHSDNLSSSTFWENKNSENYNHPCFTPKSINFSLQNQEEVHLSMPIQGSDILNINLNFIVEKMDTALEIGYILYSEDDEIIYESSTTDTAQEEWPVIREGDNTLVTTIPAYFLNEGTYRVQLVVALFKREWIIKPQKDNINIYFSINGGMSNSPYYTNKKQGLLAPIFEWKQIKRQ